ncbi:hypothetical protein HU200_057633 [Digitaria exilis]|uniref:UDP-glucose 6-dehydrogenase n=1 Tax=Digitaria exilis TaxID=1010633 RepID=A0A835APE0_9POAL|nr:hypothetical protein HU200_057633 [Digitaria exilis]
MERILLAHGGGEGDTGFQVVSNPEFFSEGTTVRDLLCPGRVLIGDRDRDAVRALVDVYAHWVPEDRIVMTTSLYSAELSKLTANTFLAQRVSPANAISPLCKATDADVSDVSRAVGMDRRIVGGVGGAFLNANVGFSGPGFHRDVLRLAYACDCNGSPESVEYWRQVVAMNEYQKSQFVRRVVSSMFGTVAGKKVTMLGFVFKKGIADTRESPAVDVCWGLLGDRADASVYDPAVSEKQILRDTAAKVRVARDASCACSV